MIRTLAVSAMAVVGLSACGGSDSAASEPPQESALRVAAKECSIASLLADADTSLTLDRNTNMNKYEREEQIECLLTALDAPQHVVDHIYATRALDGMQTASWEGFEARWTYHPDPGQQITFVAKPQE